MIAAGNSHVAILCNELAGAGQAVSVAGLLDGWLHQQHIRHTVFIGSWPDQLTGFTDVFLAGGDGTVNYFVNKYPGIKIPIVIFKGGTGNDFHWLLYGDTGTREQFDKMLKTDPRPVDLGQCNDRFFVNGVGAGFEGVVARALQAKKKLPGKTSYMLTIIKKIVTYRSPAFVIYTAERVITGKKLLVDVSNGRRAGGGFHVAPAARADDGQLDLVIAAAMSPLKRLIYLPAIEKGKHLHLPFIHYQPVTSVKIDCSVPIPFHLDGEYDEAMRLEIRIHPGALNIRF